MIIKYIIKDNKGVPYLSTISRDRAEEWLELANEGGCRGLGWAAGDFKIVVNQHSPKGKDETWQF